MAVLKIWLKGEKLRPRAPLPARAVTVVEASSATP